MFEMSEIQRTAVWTAVQARERIAASNDSFSPTLHAIYADCHKKTLPIQQKYGIVCCAGCLRRSGKKGDADAYDAEVAPFVAEMEDAAEEVRKQREAACAALLHAEAARVASNPLTPLLLAEADAYPGQVYQLLCATPDEGTLPAECYDAIAHEFAWCSEYVRFRLLARRASAWPAYTDPTRRVFAQKEDATAARYRGETVPE